ncbi:DUF4199 domain-containing protein [Pedobacter fastidiosus]|uniref:DUF4199 domain-containing protein n=1 Tax=Pedobacter fastidiosus TaxID=2765361 RepID=A0ABR7KPA2_9SPHI|nr:DUF4199 domain-containing protein [Pedobacter fastidiosus]MBC6109923.1 DUF4199 domain-containing protein [Pedobacter fastidiosus]
MEQQIAQEEKKPNALAFQVAITFALYTLALVFVMNLLGMSAQIEGTPIWQKAVSMILSYGTFILAIYYAQNKHKQDLGGFITYGRAFSTGFKVAAYSGLFIGLLMMLYYGLIDKGALQEILDTQMKAAGDNEQAVKGIQMMSKYMIYMIAFGSAITYTLFGLIISLITAAVVKKERI